ESRLGQTKSPSCTSLRHAASLNKLLDPDHDLGAQSKIARFGLSESQIPEHVAATTNHFHSLCHRRCLRRSSATERNRSVASSSSLCGVLRVFCSKALKTWIASCRFDT